MMVSSQTALRELAASLLSMRRHTPYLNEAGKGVSTGAVFRKSSNSLSFMVVDFLGELSGFHALAASGTLILGGETEKSQGKIEHL